MLLHRRCGGVAGREWDVNDYRDAAVRFLLEDDGATMMEYAIMVALLGVICFAMARTLGSSANRAFANVAAEMNTM